ncbi:hypothetical protein FOXYSP1_06495 [Fusarium oxysporum f. sp. phaseoli]
MHLNISFKNRRAFGPSAPPATPDVSLDAAGLVALADLTTIEERTVLTGNATLMDILILCPGIHMQQKSTNLNGGEYPACGNMVSGFVFRVENPATVYYLQRVGKTGYLTTLNVSKISLPGAKGPDGCEEHSWYYQTRSALFPSFDTSVIAMLAYVAAAMWGVTVIVLLGILHDWWGLGVILMLMVARLGNVIVIRRRAKPGWFGASEDGVDGDLLILLSQDRWIRIQGAVNHLKAVTSGQWLRDPSMGESWIAAFATIVVYLAAAFVSNATQFGKILILVLLGGSAGLLAITNSLTDKLLMHGYILQPANTVPKAYKRRRELAEALIEEKGRDDWAISMGMIPNKGKSEDTALVGQTTHPFAREEVQHPQSQTEECRRYIFESPETVNNYPVTPIQDSIPGAQSWGPQPVEPGGNGSTMLEPPREVLEFFVDVYQTKRDYWNPWMTTQIVWHAAQAILNHPFLHLVVLRSQDEIPQSCLFLQQKVEMALYYAGWLFRIVRMTSGIMSIVDPMLGVAVAATATVQWLFQFSKDTRVARRAQDDLSWCDEFLSHMALTWPHLSLSLIVLRKLQDLADHNRRDVMDQDSTMKFKSAWFWELLDTGIWKSSTNDLSSLQAAASMRDDFDASMCLKSHFIDPFQEEQDVVHEQQSLSAGLDHVDSLFMGAEGLEQFHVEGLSLDFLNPAFEM